MTNSNKLELSEYQSATWIPITAADLNILQRGFQHALTISSVAEGKYNLTASSWVGRIILPSLTIQINPKMPLLLIWNWLAWAYDLKDKSIQWTEDSDFCNHFGEMDWIVKFFLKECYKIYAKGIKKDYVPVQQVIDSVKGNFLAASTSNLWLKQDYRFECKYDEFTSWIPENQCIYYGLRMMKLCKFHDPIIRTHTQAMMDVFGLERPANLIQSVSATQGKQLLKNIGVNRLNQTYQPAFRWLRLFWDLINLTTMDGFTNAHSYLLNMNDLYELYIAKRFKHALKPYPLEVTVQKEDHLAEGGRIKIIPDIIIHDFMGNELILDTKYKQKKEDKSINQDVFQMLAYLTARKAKHAVLLYAAGSEREDRIKNSDMTVYQWSLNLDRVDEEANIKNIIERILVLMNISK